MPVDLPAVDSTGHGDDFEEEKTNPPPSHHTYGGTLQPIQLDRSVYSQPPSSATAGPPPPLPPRHIYVSTGYSPSTSFRYSYQSETRPAAGSPQQQEQDAEQLQHATVVDGAEPSNGSGSSHSSLGMAENENGKESVQPRPMATSQAHWRRTDTDTNTDTNTGTVTISNTAGSNFTPMSTAYYTPESVEPDHQHAQHRSSSSSASRRSSMSAELPVGANRFTPLQFDKKGKLVCQLLTNSTAPMALGVWSHNLALCTAFLCLLFGPLSLVWWHYDTAALYSDKLSLAAGVYSICLAPLLVWEERVGLPVDFLGSYFDTAVSRYAIRSVGYVVLSSLLFLSWPTVIPAISLCIVAIVNRLACAAGERFAYCGGRVRRARRADDEEPSLCRRLYNRLRPLLVVLATIRNSNRVGIVIWLTLYFGGNAVLFVMGMRTWIDRVNDTRQAFADGTIRRNQVLSYWLAPAKAFGLLLDLNCALILLPVCRFVIRWLYDQPTVNQHWPARAIRIVMRFVPLDFALHSHKLIGVTILVAAVGHTLAHFVNFALAETVTLAVLAGPWPLISGGLLIGVMLLMYSSAFRRLRVAKFELFFETHHLFVLFFVLLLVHGAHGKGPNFWKYFIGPASLYVFDRLLRYHRGRQPVKVLSVRFMQDVMCIEFSKQQGVFMQPFRTGQYIDLQCPSVSPLQWHPFTISSAPDDPTVTVHIKIHTDMPSSFTYQVAAFMASMGDQAPPPPPQPNHVAANAQVAVALGEDEMGRDLDGAAMPMMQDHAPVAVKQTAARRVEAGYGYGHLLVLLTRPGNEDKRQRVPGRYLGPLNQPLFRINGPYGAPTQHLKEYGIAVVVGSGPSGTTPLASCMQQVVRHDWAVDRPEHMYRPSTVYFVVVLQHEQIESSRWLLQLITESQLRVDQMRREARRAKVMASKRFEVHIYVTRPPGAEKQIEQREAILQEWHQARQAPPAAPLDAAAEVSLDECLLAQLMIKPNLTSDDERANWNYQQAAAVPAGSHPITIHMPPPPLVSGASVPSAVPAPAPAAPVSDSPVSARSHRLRDVRVYSGRPPLAAIFAALSSRHAGSTIGVLQCGNPLLANDLRAQCNTQNGRPNKESAHFTLHAENF